MQHGNRFGLQKGVRCVLLCGASRVAGRGGATRVASLQAAAARTEQRRDQPLADRRLLYSFARNHASILFIVAVRRRSTRVAPKPGECLRVADFSRRRARAASTLGSRLSRQRRPQARACARAQTCCSNAGSAVFHCVRSPDRSRRSPAYFHVTNPKIRRRTFAHS